MKMKSAIFLLIILQGICINVSLSTNPGFKLRLTKKGLDYANEVAHTALATELKTLKIPDQSGHDGHMDWSLSSIQNRGVAIPSSAMTFAPSVNGLTWAMSNLGIDLHADWRVKYKKGWFHVSTSGSVDLNVQRVSLQVTVSLIQAGGRPSLAVAKCDASIGNVDVKFHGGTAFILNMFKGVIADKIRHLMEGEICKVVQKEVNVDANAKLSQLKVNVEIDHRFLLDYSLVASPVVHAMDLETQHKGEVFWKADVKETPFSPNPIPPLADESRMMYLWVTDYVATSAIFNAQNHGFLQYNVTQKDFPAGNRSVLNTTCSVFCVGKFIPQIGEKYPNSWVEARVISLGAPVFSITPKGISLAGDVHMDLYAHGLDKDVHYLITLEVKICFSMKGAVVKERLTGEITSQSVTVKVIKSAIGDVHANVLNFVLSAALNVGIIPKLNTILKQGVDLPVTDVVSFQNTQLIPLNGSLLIATDLTAKIPTQQQQQQQPKQPQLPQQQQQQQQIRLARLQKQVLRQQSQRKATRYSGSSPVLTVMRENTL